ncbi:Na+/H+ antiporter subunit E [Pedomonas sp. V897]|uniref:Na+/H+ antiporter subunit E n=1 Tax=Pedomonas sp. V897 TaxID=3446482 RepID=UPI003EE2A52C
MKLLRRLRAVTVLFATFLYDLVSSSLAVARFVVNPSLHPSTAIVVYPLEARTEWGAALMAYFISLTPGSTAIHVTEDHSRIYIHMLNAPSDEAVVARFKQYYERWVLELEP